MTLIRNYYSDDKLLFSGACLMEQTITISTVGCGEQREWLSSHENDVYLEVVKINNRAEALLRHRMFVGLHQNFEGER